MTPEMMMMMTTMTTMMTMGMILRYQNGQSGAERQSAELGDVEWPYNGTVLSMPSGINGDVP